MSLAGHCELERWKLEKGGSDGLASRHTWAAVRQLHSKAERRMAGVHMRAAGSGRKGCAVTNERLQPSSRRAGVVEAGQQETGLLASHARYGMCGHETRPILVWE